MSRVANHWFRALSVSAAAVLLLCPSVDVCAAGVPGQGTWETTLEGRDLDGNVDNGFEAYYDTTLNITWLADASYAKTSGASVDGLMSRLQANKWAESLDVNGVQGWRLPTICLDDPNACSMVDGYAAFKTEITKNEMRHLYSVTLGNQAATGLNNTGPFKGVDARGGYWSATQYHFDYANPVDDVAWSMKDGQNVTLIPSEPTYTPYYTRFGAWAVHSGDVTAVPEPGTWAMQLLGLGALGWVMSRRRG